MRFACRLTKFIPKLESWLKDKRHLLIIFGIAVWEANLLIKFSSKIWVHFKIDVVEMELPSWMAWYKAHGIAGQILYL